MKLDFFSPPNFVLIFIGLLCFWGFPQASSAHGDIHERIEALTRKIKLASSNAELYLRRAELYRHHQDWQSALNDYERAAQLNPALHVVDLGRGRMFLAAGMYEQARSVLDRFLEKQPDNFDALITRGRALRQLDENLLAVADFNRALQKMAEPKPEYFIERAKALVAQGDDSVDAAIRGLDEGLVKLGQVVTLQLCAIELQVRAGHFDAALKRIELISRQSRRQEKWTFRSAEILRRAGRVVEAKAKYVAALEQIESLPLRRQNTRSIVGLGTKIRLALDELAGQSELENTNASF